MQHPRLDRRQLLRLAGIGSTSLWLAACAAPPAAAPTTAPAPTTPPATSPQAGAPAAAITAPAASPAATAAPAQKPSQLLPVRFASINGLFHLINYELARRKGILQDAGIDLTITGTTGDVVTIQGLQTNQFDVSDGGPVATAVANAGGASFQLIGATSRKLYYAIYANPQITNAQDLVGKSFGVGAVGSLPNLVIASWLRAQNIDANSVSFAALGPTPEIFKAVAAGKVDAGVAGMDFLPEARRQGLSVLTDRVAEDLPGYFMLGVYVRGDDLRDATMREAHVRFLTALAQTNRLIYDQRNKDEWIQTAVELQSRNPEDMDFFYDFMVERQLLAANVEFTPDQVQYIQQENIANGVQPRLLPFEQVGTLELQQEVVRRIGEFSYPR